MPTGNAPTYIWVINNFYCLQSCVLYQKFESKYFWGNTNMYFHFLSFFHTGITKVIEFLFHGRQDSMYPTKSIQWLLVFQWFNRHKFNMNSFLSFLIYIFYRDILFANNHFFVILLWCAHNHSCNKCILNVSVILFTKEFVNLYEKKNH